MVKPRAQWVRLSHWGAAIVDLNYIVTLPKMAVKLPSLTIAGIVAESHG